MSVKAKNILKSFALTLLTLYLAALGGLAEWVGSTNSSGDFHVSGGDRVMGVILILLAIVSAWFTLRSLKNSKQ